MLTIRRSFVPFVLVGGGFQNVASASGTGYTDIKKDTDPAWSETSCMYRTISSENREIPGLPTADGAAGRVGKSKDTRR